MSSPFSYRRWQARRCFSKVNGQGAPPGTFFFPDLHGRPGFAVDWQFPMLLAAVDPAAEAKLDGLNHALAFGKIPGRRATATRSPTIPTWRGDTYPVLAATDSGIGEYAESQVQRTGQPPARAAG